MKNRKTNPMKKDITFRFTDVTSPGTEVTLSGRKGRSLGMTLSDGRSMTSVSLDADSVVRLRTFLEDFLRKEPAAAPAPLYTPTGRALAIMDGDTLDIRAILRTPGGRGSAAGSETDSYESLRAKAALLTGTALPESPVFIFFDLFDGTIAESTLSRILKACASYQVHFLRTGDFRRARPMTLEDIETSTSIDMSQVSRATGNVAYVTRAGRFTLNAADPSLETPSLFDEASPRTDGRECSRKEVLSVLRDIIGEEDRCAPLTDQELSSLLLGLGYIVARRTVSKYRDLLGIPKSCRRCA